MSETIEAVIRRIVREELERLLPSCAVALEVTERCERVTVTCVLMAGHTGLHRAQALPSGTMHTWST